MGISSVAGNATASTAQSNAIVAQAQAKAANQRALVTSRNENDGPSPALQAPAVKPSVNSNGQSIGTTINVSA